MGPRSERAASIDVTGLSDEAIRAVESLVASLREQANGSTPYNSPEDWCKALREWAASHKHLDVPADWSRDTIYSGRGE